ncbi:MAG: hypothetical protein HY299_18140 [Verrucomicrobia bacterium]|nr:hypothetical protein [Verrucomicrobiota bacterium]
MTLRPIKLPLVLVLGFTLAWQGVFASTSRVGATTRRAMRSCCCAGCDNRHCATPACCVKRDTPSVPLAPASLPSASQNEFHALAVSVVALITLPSRQVGDLPACASSIASVTSIPLFQRDCSYLL